jgi:glycerophosphoryl diester phosphodiesterase
VQQILPSLVERQILFAHRGARAHARENTLEAFALAGRLGADGIETDAWMTRDGIVVLDHDGVVRRGFRRTPMSDVDRRDLPDFIPSLPELLDTLTPDTHLSIDVKDSSAADAIVSACDAAGHRRDCLWLCHPDVELVASWRRLDGVRLVNSTRLDRLTDGAERRCSLLARDGIDVLNMPQQDWTGGLTTLAHRFGVLAFAWDAQQEHRIDELLRMGIDGVYGDHVDRLVEARHKQPARPPTTGP